MDRRLLLAVVLSALVLLIFQVWIAPKPVPRQPPAEPITETGRGTERSPQRPPAELRSPATDIETAPPEDLFAQQAESEEVVTVRTGWVEAGFTNRGGQLLTWRLPKYTGPDELPVSIVRGPSELGLVVDGPSGSIDLRNVLFSAREETGNAGARKIIFQAGTEGGLMVTKTYTIPAEGYLLDLAVDIRGAGSAESYRLTWDGGIPRGEKNLKHYDSSAGSVVLAGKDLTNNKPGSFKKESQKLVEGNIRWAGVRNKYFAAIMIPPQETSSRVITTGDNDTKITGTQIVMPVLRGEAGHAFGIYLGPMEYDRLKGIGNDLEQAVDLGWKVFRPLSKVLLATMVWMYRFLPNYGIIIIILSVATKFLFYPLTKTSLKSMKAMQGLQPKMQELRDKHKGDPQRVQSETMKLYKEHKVNPMGGCLPMLVQMPVFVALYSVLANSITMRQANFVGWINDLSTPDTIAVVAGFAIHILPLVMFVTTIFQQKLTPATDPRQKMMGYMMPAVMLFIFYSFPAGLTLYWTVNNALQVGQQWMIHREEPAPA